MAARDLRFSDFSYPNDDRPAGVIERGIPESVLTVIKSHTAHVAGSFTSPAWRWNQCRYVTTEWERVLKAAGVGCHIEGGAGQHDVTIPPTAPGHYGGYRTDDAGIVLHYWLAIGPRALIFDPTAHQFDRRGGVLLGDWCETRVLTGWRERAGAATIEPAGGPGQNG